MGFSATVAGAVVLVGVLYFGSVMGQSYISAQRTVQDGLEVSEERALLKRNGAVRIDSESYNGGLDRSTILVTNVGGVTFDAGQVDVLLDGVVKTSDVLSRTVGGIATDVWSPGAQLQLVVQNVDPNPARTIVVTMTGATDTEVN